MWLSVPSWLYLPEHLAATLLYSLYRPNSYLTEIGEIIILTFWNQSIELDEWTKYSYGIGTINCSEHNANKINKQRDKCLHISKEREERGWQEILEFLKLHLRQLLGTLYPLVGLLLDDHIIYSCCDEAGKYEA